MVGEFNAGNSNTNAIAGANSKSAGKSEVVLGKDSNSNLGYMTSNKASVSASPSEMAKSFQGKGDCPGIDNYTDTTVFKGRVLYRGEPNGTEYFTTIDAIEKSGRSKTALFQGLQVKRHKTFGYRNKVVGYYFAENVDAAYGCTLANPQYGKGGLTQYFVPNAQELIDKGVLIPVVTINLN